MKTKRKANRLPSSQPEETSPTLKAMSNPVKSLLEKPKDITCSVLITNTIGPHSSTKKTKVDNIIVRRSQRIQSGVPHPHNSMLLNADPDIQFIDTTVSEQDELENPEQLFPDQNLNQPQIEDIEPEQQNQCPAGSEKGINSTEDNSIELEPEEPMNVSPKINTQFQDKSKGSKNKSAKQYRAMYLESQKKLKKLTRANIELSKKLAVTEGKLEVYEKGCGILTSIIDKTKDLFIASAIPNATDQALAQSTPRGRSKKKTSPDSKRKKPIARHL